jgi:hypothetical protein
MVSFIKKKPTTSELLYWKRNNLINPRTKRNIKINGPTYKKLYKNYKKTFPNDFDYLDSVDDRDPITLNKFWIIKDNKKKFIYEKPDELVLYIDENNQCRCLEKNTIKYLKTYKIFNHPITGKPIPKNILDKFNIININKNKSIKDKCLSVFNKFTNLSIFIDYNKFLNLNMESLKKLNYEIKDFYYQNISLENRIKIDKKDGNKIFKLNNNQFNDKDIKYIQNYLLNQIEILLTCPNENIKYMLNYIVVGGLSLVIPEIKEQYPDFCFAF